MKVLLVMPLILVILLFIIMKLMVRAARLAALPEVWLVIIHKVVLQIR